VKVLVWLRLGFGGAARWCLNSPGIVKAFHLMSSPSTLEQVRLVMEDVFDLDDLVINPATHADDIEEWDSLSHIRLVVAIERRLKIKFKNAELDGLMNVGDLVKLIDVKLA
jgi:acyl carrier protein